MHDAAYNGAVGATATLLADQTNASSSQQVAFGAAGSSGDAPLPWWADLLLALALLVGLRRLDRIGVLRTASG